MIKTELVDLVDLAYGMWNKSLPMVKDDRSTLYLAWFGLLEDSNYEDVLKVIKKLAKTHVFLPTPGIILTLLDGAPSAAQAWNQYCQLRDSMHNGTAEPGDCHPRLQATIRQTGLNLVTNADRAHFIDTYNQNA